MYITVVKYGQDNRIDKYQDGFASEQEAIDFKAQLNNSTYPDAFVAEHPSQGGVDSWLVDPVGKTISFVPLPIINDPVISFGDFVDVIMIVFCINGSNFFGFFGLMSLLHIWYLVTIHDI